MTRGVRVPRRPEAALAALVAVVAAPIWVAPAAAQGRTGESSAGRPGWALARTYYVDSVRGSDDAAGTSPATAWRSLARASRAALRPGDRLLLRRGGRWNGTLHISAHGTAALPITVGTYGTGSRPTISGRRGDCVVVTGTHVHITGLRASDCRWAGFHLVGSHNQLVGVYADRNIAGVAVAPVSAHNVIRASTFADNNRMSVNDRTQRNDSGAFGILLNGDDNLVIGNVITGSRARSRDYGYDGAAVEIYNGDRNVVVHNIARNNETFTELGHEPGRTASGNLFAHNVVTSVRQRAAFLVTRGPRHLALGPVVGTIAVHNSVHLPGRDTIGVSCYDGCSPRILRLRNNIIKVGGVVGYADGAGIDDAGGVYWGRETKFRLGPRSILADPLFRGITDLRLRPGSPAIGRGLRLGPHWYGGAEHAHDMTGRPIGTARNPDAGAYQS
ncbi:NosD domain-containing protein [Thermopolyspora flexuosa]|uniref:Parallel beta helix pectate lyase-like protein n=1 Tax=Thermopolyspora flexuosa TaxID=103836 RepID=A0A543IYY2_9ACTN|nr:NosD domain-containing protein [Thermopolyspora flexuosa]TQM75785.1 parallel beta helix pectate lyase-like protein [Thermopolyspora flexuosa]